MPVSRSNFLPMPGYSGVTSYTLLKLYYYNIRGWRGVASGAGGMHAGRLASRSVKSLGGEGATTGEGSGNGFNLWSTWSSGCVRNRDADGTCSPRAVLCMNTLEQFS